MNSKLKETKCTAVCPDVNGGSDFICELEEHSKFKKHRQGGATWTNAGAQRVREELADKARRAEIE
jgi:hypothetical protein